MIEYLIQKGFKVALIKSVAIEIAIECKNRNIDIDYFKLQKLAYISQCVHYGLYKYLIETTKLDPYIKNLNIGDRIYLDKLNYYFISNNEKENFSDNYKDSFYKKLKLN